jgi:hypothetical protein
MPCPREAMDLFPKLQQRFHNIQSGYCANYWRTPYYYIVSLRIYILFTITTPIF